MPRGDVVAVVMLPPGDDVDPMTRASLGEIGDVAEVVPLTLPRRALTSRLSDLVPPAPTSSTKTVLLLNGEVLVERSTAPEATGDRSAPMSACRSHSLPVDVLSPTSDRIVPTSGPRADSPWWSITCCVELATPQPWSVVRAEPTTPLTASWRSWLLEQAAELQTRLVDGSDPDAEVLLGAVLLQLGEHDAALRLLAPELTTLEPSARAATRGRLVLAGALAGARYELALPGLDAWRPHACRECSTTLLPFWGGVAADLVGETSKALGAWEELARDGDARRPFVDPWYGDFRRQALGRARAAAVDQAQQWNDVPELAMATRVEMMDLWRRAGLDPAGLLTTRAAAQTNALEAALASVAARDPHWWLDVTHVALVSGALSRAGAHHAAVIAAGLDLTTAVQWDNALRDLPRHETVLSLRAGDRQRPVVDRVAAAALVSHYDGPGAQELLEGAVPDLSADLLGRCVESIAELAPDFLVDFVQVYCQTPRQMVEMADVLQKAGAVELATLVLEAVPDPTA